MSKGFSFEKLFFTFIFMSHKKLTQKKVKSAELLEITLLDNIIVRQNTYFSFSDEHEL